MLTIVVVALNNKSVKTVSGQFLGSVLIQDPSGLRVEASQCWLGVSDIFFSTTAGRKRTPGSQCS